LGVVEARSAAQDRAALRDGAVPDGHDPGARLASEPAELATADPVVVRVASVAGASGVLAADEADMRALVAARAITPGAAVVHPVPPGPAGRGRVPRRDQAAEHVQGRRAVGRRELVGGNALAAGDGAAHQRDAEAGLREEAVGPRSTRAADQRAGLDPD